VSAHSPPIYVRNTREEDFAGIIRLSMAVYAGSPPWRLEQLASHLRVFPEGQLVAVEKGTERVMGMAASLIVFWDDYHHHLDWREFTANGYFTNHDPVHGRTLYGAEVMVMPHMQRRGIGNKIYRAREALCRTLGLLRIRAGARLRGYHKHARRMSAEEYVLKVCAGELRDPTLTFQLQQGFHVMEVVSNYLQHDPESLGHAAVIEWINEAVARPEDYLYRNPKFPVLVEKKHYYKPAP
jgi:ribosomal protein S18 acetylase RimI-like enzyme